MRGERRQQVGVLDPARVFRPLEQPARDHGLDLRQAGVLADRRGACPAELDAVVLGRVVTGGDHRRGHVEIARGEVAEIRGREPEVEHVGAGDGGAFPERGDERLRRRAGIVADEDAGGPGERDEGVAYPARDRLVELVRVDAADVVRLEDDVERSVGHREPRVLTAGAGRKSYPAAPPGTSRITGSGHSPPDERGQTRQSGERPDPAQPLRRRRAERQGHVPAGGDDDHEIGRGPPRAVGPLRLPVREVRRLHHHRDAGAGHVERDRIVVVAHVRHLHVGKGLFRHLPRIEHLRPLPGLGPVVGERPVERGRIVEPGHGQALPHAQLGGARRARCGLGLPLAPPVLVGMEVARDDRFEAQRRDDGCVGHLVDLPPERRAEVEVGNRGDFAQRRVVHRQLLHVGHRRVVADAQQLEVLHAERELRRVPVRQSAHRVRRRRRERGRGEEVVRRRRRRLVVQTFHRADAAVGPVRQHHQCERRAVPADVGARLPQQATRRERAHRVDERSILRVVLLGRVGGGATFVPGVVVLGPVGDVALRRVDAHERDGGEQRRDHSDHDEPDREVTIAFARLREHCDRLPVVDVDVERRSLVGVVERRLRVGDRRGGLGSDVALRTVRHPRDELPDPACDLGGAQRREQVEHEVPERQQPQVPRRGLAEDVAEQLPAAEHRAREERGRAHDQRGASPVHDPGTDRHEAEEEEEPHLRQEQPVERRRKLDTEAPEQPGIGVPGAHGLVAHVGRVLERRRERHEPRGRQRNSDRADRHRPPGALARAGAQPDDQRADEREHADDEMTRDGEGEEQRRDPEAPPALECHRERAEEQQRARDRDREGVLTGERVGERATHDVVVVPHDRVATVLEEQEGGRAHREQRRRRPRHADATREHVRADRHQHRAERGDELERDVVRQHDVEQDDEQRGEREVELPGREPRVGGVRPARDPPRQQVVAEVGREPHVGAGVTAGGGGVEEEQPRLQLDEDVDAADRDDRDAQPIQEAVVRIRPRRRRRVLPDRWTRRSRPVSPPPGQCARRESATALSERPRPAGVTRHRPSRSSGLLDAGHVDDVAERERAVGRLPRLRLATPAAAERDLALGDLHVDLDERGLLTPWTAQRGPPKQHDR